MAVTKNRSPFGIHSVLMYRLSDRKAYGPPVKVLSSAGVDMPADFEDLTGGSERFILASELKSIVPEMKITTKDYRNFLYELFLGATVTENAAEASGNVQGLANVKGTSAFSATAGVASIAALAGSEANLKFTRYVIVVKSATTINILGYSDVDFNRGTNVAYQNDDLEISAADVTIPALGATVDIASLGLQITGGSAGAIAMTIDDTAIFDVRPINAGSTVVDIGSSNAEFPEFGCIFYGQKRSKEMFEIECFRCVAGGFPHNFAEKTFAEAELTVKVLKDFDQDIVMRMRMTAF